jgi:hypothetical protein
MWKQWLAQYTYLVSLSKVSTTIECEDLEVKGTDIKE